METYDYICETLNFYRFFLKVGNTSFTNSDFVSFNGNKVCLNYNSDDKPTFPGFALKARSNLIFLYFF